MFARLSVLWSGLSLARRFALAAAPVLLAGMTILGLWVSGRIVEGVVRNTGAMTALYLDGIIAPLNDELASDGTPEPVALLALQETFQRPDIAARVAALRIWRQDGTLVFATDSDQAGAIFAPNPDLLEAFSGEVAADYHGNEPETGGLPSPGGQDLIEIYSPIREAWSGRIIAVAEVYQHAGELVDELSAARRQTWAVVAASALAMAAALFRIVKSGSNTIKDQQSRLEQRLVRLQAMADENRDLRLRVQSAAGRASSLNERYLRRISADLHDGPAQNLAVAALRLPRLASLPDGKRSAEIAEIRDVLDTAMDEIRGISRGLVLPELEGMDLQSLLERAVAAHESRSKTEVSLESGGIAGLSLDQPQNICVYRFVQEGLTNAFKHGGGIAQVVRAAGRNGSLAVTVANAAAATAAAETAGLGLAGLRERVESLGGTFDSRREDGTNVLSMTLDLEMT